MARCFKEIAWLRTWHHLGYSEARLSDGGLARLSRLQDGSWQAYLRGVATHTPQATWDAAREALEHALAGEGIWLRTGADL